MWIVEVALRRPYTFIVMAIAILLFGVLSVCRMAIDIFPNIDIPVVSCCWTYTGMSPYYMENMVTTVTERALTSTVNGIQRMESVSLNGMSIVKVYLQQGTNIGQSVAMVTSVGTAILKQLPRGISPPFVTSSSATDVPVLQLSLHSQTLTEAQLFDIANSTLRTQLVTVQGVKIPFPYGGKFRQVMIDLNPSNLVARGLSAQDVVQAMTNQNVIHPTGTAKMGEYEYIIDMNNIPRTIAELNKLPVKRSNGTVVFIGDVAQVHDGYQPQMNIVNVNGKRAVLVNILKNGKASTLQVVDGVKRLMPRLKLLIPRACQLDVITDESIFVRECVEEVVREAATAAGLTALMMLGILGSWRSTLIVAISIPLAMLSAIIGLNVAGQTINSMTLGGLALAVGMLVDDATVEIENVHRNLAMGKNIERAILDGAQQVALPALVSTMSICIVFVPVLLLIEPSRSLFVPLGMAVIFAMMASYGLSRTVVPLMSKFLLGAEHKISQEHQSTAEQRTSSNIFTAIHQLIEQGFEFARGKHHSALNWVLDNGKLSLLLFAAFYALSFCLIPMIGKDYFPAIDGGQLRLHVCAHPGTRVEETERIFKRIEDAVRQIIPKDELTMYTDNIGLPCNGMNFAYSDSQTISEADGEILFSLSEERTHDTAYYQKAIRKLLTEKFPEVTSYFQPGDIVTQILDAGMPSAIDVKVIGFDRAGNYEIAQKLKREIQLVPGIVDTSLHQVVDTPQIDWKVDRTRAQQLGLTQNDISNSFLVSLSSSFQTTPSFWFNPIGEGNYYLAAQTPQYRISNFNDMQQTSITDPASLAWQKLPRPQLLMNLATPTRATSPAAVNHINVAPVFDIYAAPQDRDLGGVATDVTSIITKYQEQINEVNDKGVKNAHGAMIKLAGQVLMMRASFIALLAGLVFALLLVYLLLVVNFQSWTDPLIILTATPGALAGIVWSLFVTQTTFSIPALMGAIMTIGVASANSILMITFANEELSTGLTARQAALNAGFERFRPVIMTAMAMVIGMIPMAIGAGQGGSQNAPIGRAVIGGLTVATFSTLLLVPLIFSLTRGRADRKKKGREIVEGKNFKPKPGVEETPAQEDVEDTSAQEEKD
jgi:multidrug efflux pump subunit AcrB